MSKIKNKQISNNTKTIKKDKKPKLFIASVITSILLLLSVTFAWFVNIIELPFFRAETGTIGFVAKGYESNGELIGVLKNTVQRDAETNEIVTTDQKGPLFKISNLAAGDAVSYYLSVEKSGTLDMDYALSFTIDVDETDMQYLGGFWYRVTILNSSADGSDTTLVDFNKAVGKDGNKLPLDYEPIDADYSKVVESYASYNPTNSCSSVCSREDDGSIKEHKCSEYELDAANLSTINRSSKFGTLTKSSPRQIIRVDFGLRSEAIEPEYTDLTINLYSKIYATQLGAIDNPNGIGKSYYAYDVESLKEIIRNALPGDSVFLSSNINYYGDLIFNKAISLYTNGYSLNVYGNLLYNYATSHKLDINLVGGGNISVLANDAGIGGDFTIEAPNANVNVSGVNFASAIYVSNNFNVDVTNDAKSDGISFKGLHICYPVNANGVAEPHNLVLDSDSKVLVNSGVVFNSITSKNQASNIEITNYGTINSINLASMHLVDEDDGSYYDSMSPQILIKNYGTMSSPTSPIVLPAWSVPFLTDFNSGEEHFDYYGNTKIIRYWGASEIVIFDNAQPFKDIHIIDYNKVVAYVEQIGNDISINGYPVKIRVYYRDKEDETTTIQSLLEEYYKQEWSLDGSLITTALDDIKHIEVVAVEGKYVTQKDLQFFDSCDALSSIDLREAHFSGNEMWWNMYQGNPTITNFVLPKDLVKISHNNLSKCNFEEIVIPASVNYIANNDGNLFGNCKYVYFEGNFPETYNYSGHNKYKAIFCDEAYLKTFREKLGSSKKAYPMAQRDDSGNNFVRKIDNGYELVFTSNNSSSISVGSNIRLNGEKLKITSIGSYCFANFTHEYTIEFDDSIEVLNAGAFYEQKIVGEVNFNKIKEIKGSAFYNCDLITNLVFEETKRIESSAFAGCDGLTKLDTGSVEYIGTWAFNLCANLEEASFPNCKTIDSYAIRECKLLKIVDTGSTEEIKDLAFYSCNIIKLVMPEVKTIGKEAFSINRSLAYVEMHKVEKIETSAFSYCENIYEIYLYNDDFSNVTYSSLPRLNALGNAFVKLNARSSFTSKYNTYGSFIYPVGHKVGTYSKTIGGIEFNLGEYVIYDLENGTGNYGVSVYNGQQNTNHIYGDSFTVGEDVTLNVGGEEKTYNITSVYANAFYRIITDEMTLNFTDDVVTLGSYAFHSDKTYLKKTQFINFGGVERIGYACFESNQYLVRFNSDNKIKYIDKYAFTSNSSLVEIILPEIEEFYFDGGTDNTIFVNATSLVKFEIGPNYKGTIARTLIHNSSNVRQIIFRMTDTNQFKYSRYFTDSFTYSDQLRIFVPREVYSFWNSNVVGNCNNSLRELGEMVGEYNYEVKTPYSGTQYVNLGQYCISDYTTSDGISGKAFTSFNVKNEDLGEDFEIPDSYDGVDIIRIGNKCFYNYDFDKYHNVTNEDTSENFEIPDTVLVIGIYAFYVSTVNVLDFKNVSIIGDYAFYNCDKIKGVLNANNLVTMNSHAFYDCDNIYEFYADNLNYLGWNSLRHMDNLVKLHTPNLSTIGDAALWETKNLVSFSMGEIISWGPNVLNGPVFKEVFVYSNNYTKMPTSYFHNFCNIRTRVYVYKDMISIAKGYFGNDSGNVVFPMGHKIGYYPYAAPNGYHIDIGQYIVTDDADDGILSVVNGYKDSEGNYTQTISEDYQVPASVEVNGVDIKIKRIYQYAYRFINMDNITLSFSENLETIGNYAFANFKNNSYDVKTIKHINFGGVETIGYASFAWCNDLVTFNDDNNIKSIGGQAFIGCHSLVKIVLPAIETITYVQNNFNFQNAYSLILFRLGENLSGTVTNSLVSNASQLRVVMFDSKDKSKVSFSAYALDNFKTNSNVKIYLCDELINDFDSDTAKDAINDLLRNNGELYGTYEIEVDLPYSDEIVEVNIGEYCIGQSSTGNLSFNGYNYDIEDQVNYIENVEILPTINGKTIDRIGFGALRRYKFKTDNTYNANFVMPDTITSIGRFAFTYSAVRFNDFKNVETIDYCAFYSCENLFEIKLPVAITLGSWAFGYAKNLVSVDMRQVETIGTNAFYQDANLRSLRFGNIKKINSNAFTDVAKLHEIYFHNDDVSTYTFYDFADNGNTHIYVKEDQLATFKGKTSKFGNRIVPLGNRYESYRISADNGYFIDVGKYIITESGILSYCNEKLITNNINIPSSASTVDADGNNVKVGLKSVYDYAFYYSSIGSLDSNVSINFESEIKSVGIYAFYSTDNNPKYINKINFGGVEVIGQAAFFNCKYLVEFNDNNHIKVLGTAAFASAHSLVKVILPEITTISYASGASATFKEARSLVKIEYGKNLSGTLYNNVVTEANNLRYVVFGMDNLLNITFHADALKGYQVNANVKLYGCDEFVNTYSTTVGTDAINKQLRNKGKMYGSYKVEVDLPYGDSKEVELGEYCVGESSTGNLSFNGFNYDKLDYQEGAISIPESIDGKVIDTIGIGVFNGFAFDNNGIIDEEHKTNFEFTDNIKYIKKYAFANSNVRVHDFKNVETIDFAAFYITSNIYDIYLPNVTTIAQSAFNQCSNLVVADMRNVKTIGNYGFKSTPYLSSIKFGAIETIGKEAFKESTKLYEIYFYNNDLTTYTNYEFSNYAKLHIYVKDNQISTFKSKTSTYGSKVVPLGNKVGSYIVTAGNNYQFDIGEYILTEDGILSNYNKEFVNGNLIIPAKVETIDVNGDKTDKIAINSIYPYAFNTVTMGSQENPIELSFEHGGVTEIGAYAFNNSTTYPKVIKYIDFGDVQTIKDYAFTECYYLLRFNDDNIISTIGGGAFKNCYSLVEINLPNIVTFGTSWENATWTTSHHTFLNARSLIKLDIGEKFSGEFVRYLVSNANNLRVFNLRINSTSQITKWDNPHVGFTVTNPNLKVYVYESFYSTFTNNASFGSLVKYLGDFVEDYYVDVETPYYGVQKVNIHKYVVSEVTVNDKTGLSLNGLNYDLDGEDLENFEIPSSLTYKGEETDVIKIGFRAFYKFDFTKVNPINESKENARIPDTILSIGNYAFAESKIRISNLYNVLLVGSYAFYNCDNIYIIESNCIQIANGYAFANCDKLLQVNMPTLIEAGFQTFFGCNSLLSLRTDVQTWNTSAWNSQFWPDTSTLLELTYATTPGSTTSRALGESSGYIILTNSKLVSDSIRDFAKSIPVGKQVFNCYENNGEKIEGYEIELPEYYINKDGATATIYRCLIEKHTEDFYIPSVLDSRPVTSLARHSFSSINFNNNQVILPSSLSYIDTYAFRNSSVGGTMNLNNVTSIGQYSFENTKIEKLIAPNLVTYSNDTVANMGSLEELIIPKLSGFSTNSLIGCNNLKIIRVSSLPDLSQHCANLPVNVTVIIEKTHETVNSTHASEWLNANFIGKNIDPKLNTFLVPYVDLAKYQATALKDAILKPYGEIYVTPDGLETYVLEDLGDSWNILYLITDKESVIIPNVIEVTKEDNTKVSKVVSGIDELALNTAPSMKSITLPQSYCYYEDLTFANAISLEEIIVDGSNTHFDSLDGVLYTEGLVELVSFPTKKNVVSFTTNANTVIIDSYAFANCAYLRDVVIDTSVKVIGAYAFEDTILQTITFNSSTVPYITSSRIFDEYNYELVIFVPESSVNIYKLNVALQDYRIEAIGTVI